MTRTKDEIEEPRNGRPSSRRRGLLRPRVVVPALVVVTALAAFAAYLFQPWKLFVDEVADEALPGAASAAPGDDAGAEAPPLPVLAAGRLVSHEHHTTGRVRVLRLPDRSRVLRIESLDTSNGPDLRVWVTDAEVRQGRGGWFVFDDGEYVDLGALKGNLGSQNYVLPGGVDLDELHSVSIWCRRFKVSFGAAELERPG